jgi:transcriptional regulator with XRE-family HTH domain
MGLSMHVNPMNEQAVLLAFGQHIKALRQARNLSQEALAGLANLDRTYVSGVERGRRNLSLINSVRLAQGLEVPLHVLMKFDFEL